MRLPALEEAWRVSRPTDLFKILNLNQCRIRNLGLGNALFFFNHFLNFLSCFLFFFFLLLNYLQVLSAFLAFGEKKSVSV